MKQWYSTLRINDLSWGLNVYSAASDIDNNQATVIKNFQVEGNKLNIIPGFSTYLDSNDIPWASWKIRWIASYGKYLFVITQYRLSVFENWVWKSALTWAWNADSYNITPYYIWDLYLVVTASDASEDVRFIKYVLWISISEVTPSWLPADKKFSCSTFYTNRISLWGNPKFPGNIYTSAPATVSNPEYAYNFWATWSSSQVIGDGSSIVTGFATRQNVLYCFTKNAVWKASEIDAWFSYVFSKETSTWAVNQAVIQNVTQDTFYFDGYSVRRLSYEANTLALKDSSISESVFPWLSSLPKVQEKAVSSFNYPYYKLFLRTENSVGNDICYVYNVIKKSWSIQTGIVASCSTSTLESQPKTYFGSPYETKVYVEEKTVRAYDGSPISCKFVSKEYNLWDNSDFKRFVQLETFWKITPWLTLYVDLIVEGKVVQTRTITRPISIAWTSWSVTAWVAMSWAGWANSQPMEDFVYRFEMFNDGRNFKVGYRSEGYGNLEINGFNLMYKFLKNYPLHY